MTEALSPEEQEETERKKREGSRKGEQYAENTMAAKEARKDAQEGLPTEGYDDLNVEDAEADLEGLSDTELDKDRAHEEEHKNRKTPFEQLERKIGDGGP